jgi:flagellin
MLSLQTNVAALSAQNNLTANNGTLQRSMERLSSGFRINRASDDAAGLAISQKMQAQIGGLNQAVRNANDGVSMIQTAEGALDQVQTMMQRIRNLSVQAASDTNGLNERSAIDVEIQQLQAEIDNISGRTTFNGLGLLNGNLVTRQDATASTAKATVVVGTGTISSVDVSGAKAGTVFTFSNVAGVLTLSDGSTSDIVDLSTSTGLVAANGGSATITFKNLGVGITITNAPGTSSTPPGAAVAAIDGTTIATALDTLHVDTAAGNQSAVLQTGADATDANTTRVSLLDTRLNGGTSTQMLGLATAISSYHTAALAGTATTVDATALITSLDSALNWVSSQRANLGAAQNRLGYAAASLSTTAQNVSAANSQIRDADVAAETASMSKSQILMQAGISVLAQANQVSQLALKLLNG